MSDINVVPYIDVMLVLLVIFMVTAPLVSPSIINLPTVGGAAPQQQTPPVDREHQRGRQHERQIQGRRRRAAAGKHDEGRSARLHADRAQSHPDQPVVIAADKTVKYEVVMNVMSDLKARGVKRVGLLVKSQ